MQELLRIARFEIWYQFRQPYFYGLLLLMAAQGLAVSVADYQRLADVTLLTNAPILLYLSLANTGPLLVAAVSLLTGQVLLRDRDYRVTYLYALPIAERAYFSGQLLGCLGISVLLGMAYAFGLLLVPFWVNGPTGEWPLGSLADGFIRLLLPNLVVMVCLSYALTAQFRHITGAYIALLALTLANTLLQLSYLSVVEYDWVHLLDPFGAISIRQAVEIMPTADKNTSWPDTPELLYINRLLWLGLSGWLIARADEQLSFQYMTAQGKPFQRMGLPRLSAAARWQRFDEIPVLTRAFTSSARWKTAVHLAVADVRWLVRQTAVAVGLLLLTLGIVGYALGVGDAPYGQRLLPFTSRMTFIRLPMHLYISLFLVVFTGELIHRNRTSGAWQLVDATPLPAWVRLLGHVGAMLLLAGAITTTLLGTGLCLQLLSNQTPIDWLLYANDLGTDGLLRYGQLIALSALISTMTPNRLVGHGLTVLTLAGLTFLDEKSGGMAWWLYGTLPASRLYSDITGFGSFAQLRPVAALLWTAVATMLLLLTTRLAQRGLLVGPKTLFQRWYNALNKSYVAGLAVTVIISIGSGLWLAMASDAAMTNTQSNEAISPYNTTTEQIRVSNTQRVNVVYHYVHPQNLGAVQTAVTNALRQGARWLGPFPHQTLRITETPFSPKATRSTPASIALPEREGWMTNTTHTDDAGQLALVVARQVLSQWLSAGFGFVNSRQSGLLTDGLAGYLALRVVHETWGDNWLKGQLTRQEGLYRRGRGQNGGREPVVMQAAVGSYVAIDKAPLSLTCIGEVWGHETLCQQIGRFYQAHKTHRTSAEEYVQNLQTTLPNDLKYAANYLLERPQFAFSIGWVWTDEDRIGVRVTAHETMDDGLGHTREKLPSDYVPVVLLDATGKVIHRELVLPVMPERDLPTKAVWLPHPANAATVVIDPLGAWPETNRMDNRKQLVHRPG
ncbi:ABC transporter permease [Fibrella aquatilis]|uniref:ABC-type transport system involved in multi-copper enzyme maturation, permease component n=1 Tax=Fibrella aquatilis TaxID=2817059 RepID=A0A939JXM7_9BACT|nr:hypothetical protein [Fibrella aquatilis]MBO0933127.1 hypothetical protein [Fibrella aquatilis]